MKRTPVLAALLFACGPCLLSAQITWSGIYDFEIKKGGVGSKPELNELSNENLQLNVRNLQLFFDAVVDNDVSITGKMTTTSRNKSIDVQLAFVTFWRLAGSALNVSAGKILTPFGSFARRQLSPDNPLIGSPLFFYYQTNVSPAAGYLDSNGVLLSQSLYGGRLSTMYTGGYYVGAEAFGAFADDLVQYDMALLNAPLASTNSEINLDKQVAFHGRIAVRPAIWGTLGASFCTGSFLERVMVNGFLNQTGGTERFKQRAIGLDLSLSYLYYEINAEYVNNRFNAPYIVFVYDIPPYKSGLTGKDELLLSSTELLVDLKIDAPFYPGLYVAGRYNRVRFGSITDPLGSSSTFGKEIPWDRNVQRYGAAIGYKPVRGVLIKVGYEWTKLDIKPQPDLDAFGTQVSVSF